MADDKKKQIPLRISAPLWKSLANWAEDDFRSINGQIEYLLTECVKRREAGKPLFEKNSGNDGGSSLS